MPHIIVYIFQSHAFDRFIFVRYMFFMEQVVIQKTTRGKVVNLSNGICLTIDFMLRDQKRLWNWIHELNVKQYEHLGNFIFYKEAASLLTQKRQAGIFAEGSVVAQQQCLRSYEKALKDSFPRNNKRKGFPSSKKHTNDCSLRFPSHDISTVRTGNKLTHVKLPKIGLIRIRDLTVPIGSKINSYCLKKQADCYWLSVQFEVSDFKSINNNPSIVGIDAGLSVMTTFSDGEQIPALKPLKRNLKKLRTQQRSLSRKKRGSVNRRRQAKKVARVHVKVKHARRNAQHQLSSRLIKEHGTIAIETLSLSGLKRLKHQGFAWSDIGIGELYRQIRYKAKWAGVEIYEHPKFSRSTGCCPDCRHIGERLDLRIRTWTCTQCGAKHDRDIAAAKWLALCAKDNKTKVGAVCPEPVRSTKTKSPKRGRLHTAVQPVAGMRSEPPGHPVHDGSPANIPSDTMCLAHTLAV